MHRIPFPHLLFLGSLLFMPLEASAQTSEGQDTVERAGTAHNDNSEPNSDRSHPETRSDADGVRAPAPNSSAIQVEGAKAFRLYDPFTQYILNFGLGTGPTYGGGLGVRAGFGVWHNQVSLGLGIVGVHAGYRLNPFSIAIYEKANVMPFFEAGYGPSSFPDEDDASIGLPGGYTQGGLHLCTSETGGIFGCWTIGVGSHSMSDGATWSFGYEMVGGSDAGG